MEDLKVDEFKKHMIGEFLLIDVRTDEEYGQGNIDGSKLIPIHELEDRLHELAPYREKKILVYCRSGARSMVAVRILFENGFNNIVNLAGGYMAWARFAH